MPAWLKGWVQVKNEAGNFAYRPVICIAGGRSLNCTLHPAEKGEPMAKLLVQESDGAREFELVDLEVNIGRELDNTLRLADPSISRHHAVIRLGTAGYEIHDLQSSNGVLLNGNRVPSAPLHDGDRITLGQMQLTFVDPPASPGAGANPLGTVRMTPEAMARIWAGSPEPGAPAAAADPELPAGAAPAPVPPLPKAPPATLPGPAFLHPYLPSLPDPAVPLRTADGSPERADFLVRVQAGLIDASPMLVIGLLGMVCTFLLGQVLGCLFGLLNLVMLVGYLVLFPLYWMKVGASPGKKIMKLRVVPEADPGGLLDLNAAIMRLLGYLANGAISWIIMDIFLRAMLPYGVTGTGLTTRALALVVWALPYLLILGAGRKALEDRFSRSIVIKVDR